MHRKNVSGAIVLMAVCACVAVAMTFGGCSTKSKVSDDTATTGVDSLVVTASPASITTSVSTVVEALALADGVPVEGEEITFTLSPALSGTLTPAVDTTGADGVAATIFLPETFGEVTVTATAGDGDVVGYVSINVDVEETQTGNGFVWLTADPATLSTGEEDTSTISIQVRDTLQVPVPAGTEVVIVAGEKFVDEDLDGYYTPGVDQLTGDLNSNGWWDPYGTIDSVATTDASGMVEVQYVGTSLSERTVYVRATIRNDNLSGFDKDSIKFVAFTPPQGHVWVTVAPSVFVAGQEDTATVRIEVRDSQQEPAPAGTEVMIVAGERFTDVDGDGFFTPAVDVLVEDANGNGWWDAFGTVDSLATTDAQGVVTTQFITGLEDYTVYLKATVNDSAFAGYDEETIQFVPYIPPDGFVWITASDTVLVANGTDATTIRIEVRGPDEQPAPAGTQVRIVAGEKFTDSDGDGSFTPGVDQLLIDANGNGWWDAFGTIQGTALTDGNGVVNLVYTAGTDPYDVYIRVTVDDPDLNVSDEVKINISEQVVLHSIYLDSDSLQLVVTQTGGIETGMLTATAYDVFGNPVPAGYPISFQIMNGPGGDEHLYSTDIGYGPYVTETNDLGQAYAPLTADTVSGTVRIRAMSDTILSNATEVVIAAGPPSAIWIGADTCNVPFWGLVNFENGVVAVVSDRYNNPVNDSTVVYWSCDEGVIKATEGRTVEHAGVVESEWVSVGYPPAGDGIVEYWAETAGGTVADTAYFYCTYMTDTLFVTGVPATIVLDGKTEYKIWVEGEDFHSLPVVDGTEYEADATYVSVSGGTLQGGCIVAWDRSATITSTTLDYDYSTTGGNDDGIGAYDEIVYWSGYGAITSFDVVLLTGNAYAANCTINGATSAGLGETLSLSATIKDRWGNPLGDHTLNMTASGGVVTNGTQESDAYGEAHGFQWTAPGAEGDFTITITDTDPRGGITFSVKISVSA